jgi:hypothetical protein
MAGRHFPENGTIPARGAVIGLFTNNRCYTAMVGPYSKVDVRGSSMNPTLTGHRAKMQRH